ncbi:MAG TPA: hypothetical protein VLW45_09815 [Pelomicrobium sp.]|nr:hypothetical protein [Pelomicrobium sp.]
MNAIAPLTRAALLALAILLPLANAADAAGENRRYFRSWLAICPADGFGACSASAYVRPGRDPRIGFDFQLKVGRDAPADAAHITFTPVFDLVAEDADLTVQVDAEPSLRLAPGSGFQAVGSMNEYRVIDVAVGERLLRAMREGNRIEFRYRSRDGKAVRAEFSLIGLTAALNFFDTAQRAGAAPPAAAGALPSAFQCTGNEPSWGLRIDGDRAEYSRLGGPEKQALTGQVRALEFLRPRLKVWRGAASGVAKDLVAFISEERCADTMADQTFPFSVRISMPDGEVLAGCCRPAPPRP